MSLSMHLTNEILRIPHQFVQRTLQVSAEVSSRQVQVCCPCIVSNKRTLPVDSNRLSASQLTDLCRYPRTVDILQLIL